ncbi:hypothetical protein DES53_101946 [Roseimicrobium gellanilyticum]|uniref:Uncharacterized protein n=1 Tax=Roseimicrobium gellanilyticum TaxID=748857 RepID=A0A366HV46_9BACT|nr:hypothetical protein [Roseimicrobium gellanilyticum]RBP48146.1 hypothetical protein DES53_101946 [Roseimicrobium gellanilyticum]
MKSSSALFISKDGLATFWFLLAAGAVVGAAFYVYRLINKTALRPQYIIMTNPDVKPLSFELDPAKLEVRDRDQTRLLLDSVFNKSPSGLDAADRCRRMMSGTAWKWVQTELLDKQNDAFRDGQMHQKIEVERIDLRRLPEQGATLAMVSGQLLRTGIHEGRLFNEVWAVKADILWLPNTSLLEHGRIPIICHRFTCRETPVASTLRRTQEGAPPLPPSTSTPAPDAAPN